MQFIQNQINRRTVLRGMTTGAAALSFGSVVAAQKSLAASSPEIEANKALVRRFYQGFSTGDFSIFMAILAPDWKDYPLAPGQQPGREGFEPVVKMFRTTFPDLTATNEDILADGDKVMVRSTIRGTHKGTFLGVPATGKEVSFGAMDIHQVANGLIAETWHIEELVSVLFQIGGLNH